MPDGGASMISWRKSVLCVFVLFLFAKKLAFHVVMCIIFLTDGLNLQVTS